MFRLMKKNKVYQIIILIFFALFLLFLFYSCGLSQMNNTVDNSYFIIGSRENQEVLRDMFLLLENEYPGSEEQFTVIREIINHYVRQREFPRLINFLTNLVNSNTRDSYNTYYLYIIATAYMQQEAHSVAALYFNLIIKNYPDLTVSGESIHLASLNQLLTIIDNPEKRIWYYEELISRFSDQIDLGQAYFLLAQAYERSGEWASAIRAYTQFLPYMDANVPGFPNADIYARQMVDFHNSPKDWTFPTLNTLVDAIKNSLDTGSYYQLEQTRAKVNFFARSWGQDASDESGTAAFHLLDFMRSSRISFSPELDAGSNANEAYLRTWGWSQYLSTWYLYFRKINFPADPDIHGRWEWAGVYYGEKF